MELSLMIADVDESLVARCKQWCSLKRTVLRSVQAGVECLEELRRSPPDVLALAIDLPWGGGDGVLAVMAEESRLIGIPVILLTRAESITYPRGALPANVIGCLIKPFEVTALFDIAHTALGCRSGSEPVAQPTQLIKGVSPHGRYPVARLVKASR